MADDPLRARRAPAPNKRPRGAPGNERARTVLFVAIDDSSGAFESLAAAQALTLLGRCLRLLEEQVITHRGQPVKHVGRGLLCVFPDASTAATAAIALQQTIEHFAHGQSESTTLRVGFHSGPVIEQPGDVFGDSVNLAARLLASANPGQILTDSATLAGMRITLRRRARTLDRLRVRGRSAEVEIVEIGWRRRVGSPATTEQTTVVHDARRACLLLTYRQRVYQLDSEQPPFTLGRDRLAMLQVDSRKVSRQHACIEWRRDKFILIDYSTNGTYVCVDREPEIMVKHESFPLQGAGSLSLGEAARTGGPGIVQFECR